MEAEAGRASIRLQLYGEAGSGTLILLQDTADLPVHWRWIEVALGTRHTNCQPFEGRFDPPAELVVHRPFFAAPIVGTTQDHRLFGLGVACELDLDALVDRAPAVRSGERRGELLQLRLRRPNDVASAGLAQPRQIGGAGYAAIGDPNPSQHSMPGLHGGHDRLQGSGVVGVAGEHFVAQGKTIEGHDESDAHLLAVGPMIPGVAALRQRVGFGLAFEIRARDIIEQYVVLDRKQLAAALRQMRFKGRLVHEQMIEAAIKAILVDLPIAELQQIAKCRAPVPILGNVQLARRLAEPRRHQHACHRRPGNAFLAHRKQSLAQLLKARPTPQRKRQIHIAELAGALDANPLQAHRNRQMFAAIIEQWRLLGSTDQSARKNSRLNASVLIELTQMRHRLLDDASPDAHAAYQAPIAMNLSVLLANRVAQVHAPSEPRPQPKKIPKVVTTRSNHPRAPSNPLILVASPPAKPQKPPPNCASWANFRAQGRRDRRRGHARWHLCRAN